MQYLLVLLLRAKRRLLVYILGGRVFFLVGSLVFAGGSATQFPSFEWMAPAWLNFIGSLLFLFGACSFLVLGVMKMYIWKAGPDRQLPSVERRLQYLGIS